VEVRISRCSWLLGGAVLAGALLLTGCASSGSSGGGGASASASTSAIQAAQNACGKRPAASGKIYVRTIASGELPQVQELGGGWGWDSSSNKCVTSVQYVITHASQGTGVCTQVAYVADNPGYHMHSASAPRLKHVVAEAGPGC
jgi:hypothetical protein